MAKISPELLKVKYHLQCLKRLTTEEYAHFKQYQTQVL